MSLVVAEMAGQVTISKRMLQKMQIDCERSKQAMRETKIKEKTESIVAAAPKRAVGHLMKTLHLLEDMSDVWTDIFVDRRELVEEAQARGEGGEVPWVREENMQEVEEALVKQQEVFVKLKDHVTYELGMQTLGGKSKYGFKLVKHREEDPDFNKEVLKFDESDVRNWEKAYVQRERKSLWMWMRYIICVYIGG